MIRFRAFLSVIAAVLIGAAIFGAPSQAQAAFSVRVTTSSGSTDYADNVGLDTNNELGVIDLSLNGVTIHVSGKDTGGKTELMLHVQSGAILIANVPLSIQASLTEITTGPTDQKLKYAFTGGVTKLTMPNPTLAAATMQTWISSGHNDLFGSNDVFDTGPTSANTPEQTSAFSATPNYSLTTKITFNIPAGAAPLATINADSNNTITATPVPPGLVLVASSFPIWVVGVVRRRRFSAQQKLPDTL